MKKLLLSFLSLCAVAAVKAQVDGRVFTITSQAYGELASPTVITTSGWDDFSAQVPLGFNFTLFGQTTNTIYFDAQGLGADMQLSLTAPSQAMVFITDFVDKGNSTVSYKTETISSHKVTKIQWKNAGFVDDTSSAMVDSANFQLWLHETSGDIEVHWGASYIQSPSVFFLGKALFGFAKNFNVSAQSFDSAYYVSSTSPATITGMDYFTLISAVFNSTPIGFADTYPASGTVFKFAKPATGINGLALNNNIEVYPTLVTNTTTVDLKDVKGNTSIHLIDMAGKLVLSQAAVSGKNLLDMSALAAGSYVLCIANEVEKVFYKISRQ